MQRGFARFMLGRAVQGVLFVLVVSSAALLLTQLAPGDHLSDLGADPTVEDHRFHSTALGWARHFGHQVLATLLDAHGPTGPPDG